MKHILHMSLCIFITRLSYGCNKVQHCIIRLSGLSTNFCFALLSVLCVNCPSWDSSVLPVISMLLKCELFTYKQKLSRPVIRSQSITVENFTEFFSFVYFSFFLYSTITPIANFIQQTSVWLKLKNREKFPQTKEQVQEQNKWKIVKFFVLFVLPTN